MNLSSPLPWLRFIRLSSEEGERWVEEYRRNGAIVRLCEKSVEVLRRRRYEEGHALLQCARKALHALDGSTEPSVRAVVERWYYGALGFCLYSREAFDEADCTMARAHNRVVAAIERKRCLLPLALDCYEFALHRARIARERQHWAQMAEHAQAAAAMRTGERPLCTLGDGTSIWMADVQRFYRSVPGASAEDQAAITSILDDNQNRLNAERSVWYVFRLPGFVIQYP